MRTTNSRPIHQEDFSIGEKDQLCQVGFHSSTRRKILLHHMYRVNNILLFSDGASAHFKNNINMFNLIHHKTDFDFEACWTFTATGHGKSAGDGIGAALKSTARRATLSKNIRLSTAKDFFEFSKKQQLETTKKQTRTILLLMCSI